MNDMVDRQGLIIAIQAGILAVTKKDVYGCGMRNGMRWCKALLEDKPLQFEDPLQYCREENKP
jgi:hypothetical protein